ncbi:MAG: hypothetical protein EPO20_06050 [Betaproteobacteria bacterium]|nr:MAG: hypothetical protein EPO20_06050 [Betaproteobacteria bacterium]
MMFFPERLAQRREALVALSTAQRQEIARALAPAVRKLAAADRALETLRAHPLLVGAIAAALGFLGPRRLLFWAARALPVYSLLRRRQ